MICNLSYLERPVEVLYSLLVFQFFCISFSYIIEHLWNFRFKLRQRKLNNNCSVILWTVKSKWRSNSALLGNVLSLLCMSLNFKCFVPLFLFMKLLSWSQLSFFYDKLYSVITVTFSYKLYVTLFWTYLLLVLGRLEVQIIWFKMFFMVFELSWTRY